MIIVCRSIGSRPILVLDLFAIVPRLFGTTSRCLSIQPIHLLPSKNIWRHISLFGISPIDTFMPMACWCYGIISSILLLNTAWLLRHWAWLRRGYWRYRSLIDWLIDWLMWAILWRKVIPLTLINVFPAHPSPHPTPLKSLYSKSSTNLPLFALFPCLCLIRTPWSRLNKLVIIPPQTDQWPLCPEMPDVGGGGFIN